nr:DC STAMP domain containing protein 2 [Hymenolepis microstoma]
METPSWIKRIESVLEVLATEDQEDDLEEPSLYKRIETAYRENFDVSRVKNQLKKKAKPPPHSKDNNNNLSENIEYLNNFNVNQSKEMEKPYTVKLRKFKKKTHFKGDLADNDENVEDLEKLDKDNKIEAVLSRLEKPTLCAQIMRRIGSFCDQKCCKYTTRIYFRKPHSWYSVTADLDAGTLLRENYMGIVFGILIGFITYLIFASAFAHAPNIATLAACYIMMFAVFGIAFSADFRCVLINTIPYIVASRTRWMLLMIATTLVTTGPAINFMHNSGNFRNAIACVLGQVNSNAELVAKITSAPIKIIRRNLGDFVEKINDKLTVLRNTLKKFHIVFFTTTNLFTEKTNWVNSIVEACGDEVAMKNQCLAFFNQIFFNCQANMAVLSFLCQFIRMFAAQACKAVSGLNDICKKYKNKMKSEMLAFSPVSEAELEDSEDLIKTYVGTDNITLDISDEDIDMHFGSNFSAQGQVTDLIEEKMDHMMSALNNFKYIMQWLLVIWTLITVIQLIVQSARYRRHWIKKPHFNNTHITSQFVAQERKAAEHGRPTALPLTFFEKFRYVNLTSWRWSTLERQNATKSLIFLFLAQGALFLMIVADYAMYHVVMTTTPAFSSDFGDAEQELDVSSPDSGRGAKEAMAPQIDGNSSMADISRSFLQLANPLKDIAFSVDASICRPKASEPDHQTTIIILCVMAFTLISVVIEVYVLRLRHLIMAWYYPTAALRRAAWLRTYIRNRRGLFLRLIHRMRSKKKRRDGDKNYGKMDILDWFLFANPKLAKFLKLAGISRVFCAQCASPGNPKKTDAFQEKFTQCPRCGVFYCKLCQSDLKGLCANCNVPLRLKAVDADFEVCSSDEEYNYFYNRYFNRRRHEAYKIPKCPPSLEETIWPYSIAVSPDLIEKLQEVIERRKTLKEQEEDMIKRGSISSHQLMSKGLSGSSMPYSTTTDTGTKMTTRISTINSPVTELKEKTQNIRREIESKMRTARKTEAPSSFDSSKPSTLTSSETSSDKTKFEGPSISLPSELSEGTVLESRISPLEGTGKEILLSTPKFSSLSNDLSYLKPLSSVKDSNMCINFSSIGGISSLNCSSFNAPENFRKHMQIDREFQELYFLPRKKRETNKSNAFSSKNSTASESISGLSTRSSKTTSILTLTRGTTKNRANVERQLSPLMEEGALKFTSHRDHGTTGIPVKGLQVTNPNRTRFHRTTNDNPHQTYFSSTNLRPRTIQNTRDGNLVSTVVFFETPSSNERSGDNDANQNTNNSNKNAEPWIRLQKEEVSIDFKKTPSSYLVNDSENILSIQQDTNNSPDISVFDNDSSLKFRGYFKKEPSDR